LLIELRVCVCVCVSVVATSELFREEEEEEEAVVWPLWMPTHALASTEVAFFDLRLLMNVLNRPFFFAGAGCVCVCEDDEEVCVLVCV
jgi:hypothetical protein